MTPNEIIAEIKALKAEFTVEENASWKKDSVSILQSLDNSGFCTSPNARKALMTLSEIIYRKGYQCGSLNTIMKLMKSIGLQPLTSTLENITQSDPPFDPSRN